MLGSNVAKLPIRVGCLAWPMTVCHRAVNIVFTSEAAREGSLAFRGVDLDHSTRVISEWHHQRQNRGEAAEDEVSKLTGR